MKSIAIIAEYNPFHNGHAYQLRQFKHQYPEAIICIIMSGPFTQRGDMSFVHKWAKTEMALHYADVIVELPYAFATGNAETFAKGGVKLAEALRVDALGFSSEHPHYEDILTYAQRTNVHLTNIHQKTQALQREGNSYPVARTAALRETIGPPPFDLTKPNNILSYEYIKAALQKNKLQFVTIQRKGSHYNDTSLHAQHLSSATAIRQHIYQTKTIPKRDVPPSTAQILTQYDGMFGSFSLLYPYLQYTLLREKSSTLKTYFEVDEGIENRLIEAARYANSATDFLNKVATKRYTNNKIRRMCSHIVTNYTKAKRNAICEPTYIRLLGMTKNGQKWLNENKRSFSLPIIFSPKQHDASDPLLQQDVQAQTLYTFLTRSKRNSRTIQTDFSTPPVRY